MRLSIAFVIVLAGCSGITVQVGPAHDGPVLTDLGWLIGAWETAPDEHGCTYHEAWARQSDRLLSGHAHETCDASMAERQPFAEELRLEADTRDLVYVAWPTGQERTEFEVTSGSANGFVAEAPDHDFPTRIEYRRSETGIDAIVSGPDRSFTLAMHRATSGSDE